VARLTRVEPDGFFEKLYAAARDGQAVVPWDRAEPTQVLVEWATRRLTPGDDRPALVVGCGYGRDAEYVASFGYRVTAFDISESAIREAKARHPGTAVRYVTADLLAPPPAWFDGFDLVVECMTVQSLPVPSHPTGIRNVGRMVRPGGTLIVVAGTQTPLNRDRPGPPWLLRRDEIEAFAAAGLDPLTIEEIPDQNDPAIHRWRAEFHR
jgi:SAM-dependent methyltransferase